MAGTSARMFNMITFPPNYCNFEINEVSGKDMGKDKKNFKNTAVLYYHVYG